MMKACEVLKGSPLEGLSRIELESIQLIISDVDDTITSQGRLRPCALEALESAERKGYRTVLLSGGSAGWCEVYLRQWPVYMVIAESGAVLMYRDEKGNIQYQQNPCITEEDSKKREDLLKMIGHEYLSSDQYARLYDIAVDLSRTPADRLDDIRKAAQAMGAHYAQSSIHLNIWFGDYSKRKGLIGFMELCGIDEETLKNTSIYLGDAQNDEEMFDLIPLSVGMKSVADNREAFRYLPAFIAEGYGGEGFAETISLLPERR